MTSLDRVLTVNACISLSISQLCPFTYEVVSKMFRDKLPTESSTSLHTQSKEAPTFISQWVKEIIPCVYIGSCATVDILTPCVQLRTKNERESLCETGKSATETFGMILQVNGHAAMSPARSFQWNERQNVTGRWQVIRRTFAKLKPRKGRNHSAACAWKSSENSWQHCCHCRRVVGGQVRQSTYDFKMLPSLSPGC